MVSYSSPQSNERCCDAGIFFSAVSLYLIVAGLERSASPKNQTYRLRETRIFHVRRGSKNFAGPCAAVQGTG